ncbi:septum formation protein [Polynucleobacter meluiroseus]|uniref:dTTP/UTP pyrophosphatase n=1 Tax=Polynucleobacter meluiroseus TaxID=1938814 RepID=A0A240E1B1_9BURK|nr:Maf family protein [Polynucleobacter meluiroseus]SNX29229.1 septum formation protein [Polynucleobacter meluiroseus]
MFTFIYLASQSPRRQELLTQMGVRYEMLIAKAGEDTESLETPLPYEKAHDYVQRVTLAKSELACLRWQQRLLPWAPILSADTTVSLPESIVGEILGKPADAMDAARILRMLSGKTHQILTAVALQIEPDSAPLVSVQVSEVTFASLSDSEITRYIASGEPLGKAGAYGIQGLGATFIPSINGSYSGIMGLPIFEVNRLLDHAKVIRK